MSAVVTAGEVRRQVLDDAAVDIMADSLDRMAQKLEDLRRDTSGEACKWSKRPQETLKSMQRLIDTAWIALELAKEL